MGLGDEPDTWRTVQQTLCPQHAADWSIDQEWNKAPDWSLPVEVLDKEETI
jgi:predicted metal-dependent peptidase